MRDQLPNLQLLEGPQNIAKSATSPALWVDNIYGTDDNGRRAYLDRNELDELPTDVTEFAAFFFTRRKALALRIQTTFGGARALSPIEDEPTPDSLSATIPRGIGRGGTDRVATCVESSQIRTESHVRAATLLNDITARIVTDQVGIPD